MGSSASLMACDLLVAYNAKKVSRRFISLKKMHVRSEKGFEQSKFKENIGFKSLSLDLLLSNRRHRAYKLRVLIYV